MEYNEFHKDMDEGTRAVTEDQKQDDRARNGGNKSLPAPRIRKGD